MTRVLFETATLADAIKKAERIAPAKGQAFDKAAGIMLEVSDPTLPVVVRATNLEIFSMEWVDTLEIEGDPASWRIPSGLFMQVVSSLGIGSGKTVELEEKITGFSSQLHLTSGRTKARFNLLDADYYPKWGAFDPDQLTTIQDLGGRLSLIEWATSKTESPINGVHLDGNLAIATDKYRLAVTDMPIPALDEPVTIPAKILAQVLKQTGEVQFGRDGGTMLIMPDEHTQIRTVTIADRFPPTQRVMKREYEDCLTLKKDAVLELLNRANNFAGGDRIPSLKVFIGQEEFAVMMTNEEVGLLGDVLELPGQCVHNRYEIKFTPRNIIEAISACPGDTLELSYDKTNSKGLIWIDGGSGYECWVMPRADLAPSAT